jgi:hypothetical protein
VTDEVRTAPYRAAQGDAATTERGRRPRYGLAVAGLLLFATSFLPAVRGSIPIVPAQALANLPRLNAETVVVLFICNFAYAFGALVGIAAIAKLVARDGSFIALDRILAGLVTVQIGLVLVATCSVMSRNPSSVAPWIALWAIVLAYALSSFRLRDRAHLRLTVIATIMLVAWFCVWSREGLYGVRLSLGASLACLACAIAEGRAVLGRRLWW